MEQSEFEKRIAAKAEKRFDEEFKNLVQYIESHPIGGRLMIKLAVDDKEIKLVNFGSNTGIMNKDGLRNKNSELTNLARIREKLLGEYRQKEVDEILSKLENFSYLFNQG